MSDFFGIHLPSNGYTLAINFEGSLTTLTARSMKRGLSHANTVR